jgi:hypothetical protein
MERQEVDLECLIAIDAPAAVNEKVRKFIKAMFRKNGMNGGYLPGR